VRLFVAVEIDAAVVAAAQTVTAQLRERAEAAAPQARITWIPANLMHLTIRFIGNVADQEVARLVDALTARLPIHPFSLEVSGLGAFPPRGAPRVLWAGITAGTDELVRTEVETSARLQQLGIPPDDRVFSPHLTLARVREPGGLKTSALLAGLERTPLGTSRVDAITLFESRLSPKGPTYVPLHRTALRAD
jgi:RNA 2',3'-cyclic 3'-phosphodiesterase